MNFNYLIDLFMPEKPGVPRRANIQRKGFLKKSIFSGYKGWSDVGKQGAKECSRRLQQISRIKK